MQDIDLVEIAKDFMRSRILATAARMGIADALQEGERTLEQLAITCGADPAALHRLLRALAGLGVLLEVAPGCFILTAAGEQLRRNAENSVWAPVIFWADLLAKDWSCLTECVRSGQTAAQVLERAGTASRWTKDADAGAIFRAVMGTAPAAEYMPIVRSWDFSQARLVADLGGGGGSLLIALLETFPNLEGILLERQATVDAAAVRFEAEGLAGRCKLIAGDLQEAAPAGADVYILKHVLHGYPDPEAVRILEACRRAMSAASRLLIIEFVMPDVIDRTDRDLQERLLSDLNMMAVTGGRERREAEWKMSLTRAGLALQGVIAVPGGSLSIIEASHAEPKNS